MLTHQVAVKKTVLSSEGKTAPTITRSHSEEETSPNRKKGLMFIDVNIHGKFICVMIDNGTTHNYSVRAKVERLNLMLEKGVGREQAINSDAQSIAGAAKSMMIKVGPSKGKTNLSIVVMDDFKLILGLEFLGDTCTVVLPRVDAQMMLGLMICMIPTLVGQTGKKNIM
ncbi:UNVERIFIED_CONTAM: hypothetical protein Sradi_0006500 [Sesamum radiatum]|uniref:Gag-asp_proteas domain-containing protein n=1 Tax=Sesamum radiatum TaxID=300843 RepID=A0AAW2WHG2_SESRA